MCIFNRNKIRVRVHKVYFTDVMDLNGIQHYFINVLNTYNKKDIIIRKVWFEWPGNMIAIIQPGRELPVRLTPGEQWETWIPVQYVNSDAYEQARIMYTFKLNGSIHIAKSTIRKNVPISGTVPGDK